MGVSMRKLLGAVAVIAALAGCSTADLKSMNDSLLKLAGPGLTSMQLGDGSGYRPSVAVEVPGGVCDRASFDDGVRVGYITSWNKLVGERANMHTLKLQNNPKDYRNQANVQLYRNKLIGTAGMPLESSYQMQTVPGSNNCRFSSFIAGRIGGMTEAGKAYQAMVNIEG